MYRKKKFTYSFVVCMVSIAFARGDKWNVSVDVTGNHLNMPGSGYEVTKIFLSIHNVANSLSSPINESLLW